MKLIIDIPDKVYNEYREGVMSMENNCIIGNAVFDGKPYEERPHGEWGKWIITEIQCPTCFGYFETDCYSMRELNKCPNCGSDMRGAE